MPAAADEQDERIPPDQVERILEEATSSGVERLSVNGCWEGDWERVLDLAALHPTRLVPNCGLHPWWAHRRSPDWLRRLRQLLLEHLGCGLGEVRGCWRGGGRRCWLGLGGSAFSGTVLPRG